MSVGFQGPAPHNVPSAPMNPGVMPGSLDAMNGGTVMSPVAPPSQGMPTLNLQPQAAPQFQQQPAPQQQPQQPAPQFAPQASWNGFTSGATQTMPPQQPQFGAPAPAPQLNLAGPSGASWNPYQQLPPAPQFAQPQQQPAPQPQFQQPPQFAPQQPPVSTVVRDSMVRQGYAVGQYTSDEQLLADLANIAGEGRAAQQQLAWQQAQAAQQQPGGAPAGQQPGGAAPQQQSQEPQRPEWNPEWEQFVRLDPTTNTYVPASVHVNPTLAQKANEFKSWQRKRAEQVVADPFAVIKPQLEPELKKLRDDVKKELKAEFQAEQREAETDRQINTYLEKSTPLFFQVGPDGKPAVNPINGQAVMTPRGQAFTHYASNYKQQFKAVYGTEPHRADVLRHVNEQLTRDEQMGRFGQPQQQPQPGAQPQFATAPQFQPQPQQPFAPQFQPQPAYQPMAGPSAAAFSPWMQQPAQQQFAPQYAPQPQFASPQDAFVARALASQQQANYQPQPNQTIVHNAMNPQVPQMQSTDLKTLFMQTAQARGMSTEGFTT